MKIKINQIEKELCACSGSGAHLLVDAADPDSFILEANAYQASIITKNIERLIEQEESDQGDWLRAKEWRDAKSELINKLRTIIFKGEK